MNQVSGQFCQYNDPKWNLILSISNHISLNFSGVVLFMVVYMGQSMGVVSVLSTTPVLSFGLGVRLKFKCEVLYPP